MKPCNSLISLALALMVPGPLFVHGLRGVDVEKDTIYATAVRSGSFTCLDGSKTIPSSALNDDYCDCKDGSDEPGTSACKNGAFYCRNVGYLPKSIPTMFVDDGVRDCCDGTDEREGLFPNTCEKDGSALRKELEERIKTIDSALGKKRSIMAGIDSKSVMQDEVHSLEKKIEAQRKLVRKLNAQVKSYRKKLDKLAGDKKNAGTALSTPQPPPHVASFAAQVEQLDAKLNKELEKGGLKGKGGGEEGEAPSDEDIGRKIASRWTKDAASAVVEGQGGDGSVGKPADWDEDQDGPWEPPPVEDGEEDGEVEEDDDYDDYGDDPAQYDVLEEEAEVIKDASGGFLDRFRSSLQVAKAYLTGGKLDSNRIVTEHSKQEAILGELERDLGKLEKKLTLDFGPGDSLRPLFGKCVSKSVEQYSYEVCFFDKAAQNRNTKLGTFQSVAYEQGRALMTFGGGDKCWNGPNRSLKASLVCGAEEDIHEVDEPSMCEYVAKVSTPLVCSAEDHEAAVKQYNSLTGKPAVHDEL